jgi:hypothetical protein
MEAISPEESLYARKLNRIGTTVLYSPVRTDGPCG